jgi:pyruvate ferredoxin oxidoreductase delta subunit
MKPVLKGRCNFCLLCWIYCPDAAISQEEGNELGFDYDLCKGCGICARECPLKAIEMVEFPLEGREGVR